MRLKPRSRGTIFIPVAISLIAACCSTTLAELAVINQQKVPGQPFIVPGAKSGEVSGTYSAPIPVDDSHTSLQQRRDIARSGVYSSTWFDEKSPASVAWGKPAGGLPEKVPPYTSTPGESPEGQSWQKSESWRTFSHFGTASWRGGPAIAWRWLQNGLQCFMGGPTRTQAFLQERALNADTSLRAFHRSLKESGAGEAPAAGSDKPSAEKGANAPKAGEQPAAKEAAKEMKPPDKPAQQGASAEKPAASAEKPSDKPTQLAASAEKPAASAGKEASAPAARSASTAKPVEKPAGKADEPLVAGVSESDAASIAAEAQAANGPAGAAGAAGGGKSAQGDINANATWGGPIPLGDDPENVTYLGTDAFAQWAEQFGPNGTLPANATLPGGAALAPAVISVEEARKRVWVDSPLYDSLVNMSGTVPMREGFGGDYVAISRAMTWPLGERRPLILPFVRGKPLRKDPYSIFDEDTINIALSGGASTTFLPEAVLRPLNESRELNITVPGVPDRPRPPSPPPPPVRRKRKYVMPIPPSPPPAPETPAPSERQKRKHEEGQTKFGPRLSLTWFDFHEKLVEEVEAMENDDESPGWEVLFLGDSIFEPWRGTKMDQAWAAYADIPPTWDASFGRIYGQAAHVLAISGDGVKHLMWRVVNHELPLNKTAKAIVISVGTNDVAPPHGCTKAAAMTSALKLEQLLLYMRARLPDTHILVMGILPKGSTWPNLCTEAITTFNDRINAFTGALFQPENEASPPQPDERLQFVDLSHLFLEKTRVQRQAKEDDPPDAPKEEFRQKIIWDMMPDALHPSARGMEAVAAHLLPIVEKCVHKYNKEHNLTPSHSSSGGGASTLKTLSRMIG